MDGSRGQVGGNDLIEIASTPLHVNLPNNLKINSASCGATVSSIIVSIDPISFINEFFKI